MDEVIRCYDCRRIIGFAIVDPCQFCGAMCDYYSRDLESEKETYIIGEYTEL